MSWSSRVMMRGGHVTRTMMMMAPRVASSLPVLMRGKQTSASHDQPNSEVKREEVIVKRLEEVADDNDEDDEGYEETMMDYFMKRARIELDDLDSAEYHDITCYDKKLFHKVVDLWLDEVGPTKKGHRQFVRATINSLHRFNVHNHLPSYLKLLECFPDNKHTGIRRNHPFFAAFGDKLPDHQLGEDLLRSISFNQVTVDDRLYRKVVDLFGVYSPVSRQARNLMYWNPRMTAFNPHPVTGDVKEMEPVEVATRALHQMGGADLSATYRRVECGEGEELVCYQDDEHRLRLSNHDPTKPIHIRGPHVCYLANRKVEYYVMRGKERKREMKEDEVGHGSSEKWWSDFYERDWSSDKKMVRGGKEGVYGDENFLPQVTMSDEHGLELESETSEADTDVDEDSVYAICALPPTNNQQLDQVASVELLNAWLRDVSDDGNSNLKNCNVVFAANKPQSFMHDAPLDDPNQDDEYF